MANKICIDLYYLEGMIDGKSDKVFLGGKSWWMLPLEKNWWLGNIFCWMRNYFVCIVLIKSQVETRNTKRMYVDCRAKVDQMWILHHLP